MNPQLGMNLFWIKVTLICVCFDLSRICNRILVQRLVFAIPLILILI